MPWRSYRTRSIMYLFLVIVLPTYFRKIISVLYNIYNYFVFIKFKINFHSPIINIILFFKLKTSRWGFYLNRFLFKKSQTAKCIVAPVWDCLAIETIQRRKLDFAPRRKASQVVDVVFCRTIVVANTANGLNIIFARRLAG